MALAPGHYRVKRRRPDRLRVGDIDVSSGRLVALDEARLRDAPFSDDPVKGGTRVDLSSRWSLGAGASYQTVFAAPSGASLFPPTGLVTVDAALRNFLRRDWVLGLLVMSRHFADDAYPAQFFATLSPGLVAGGALRLTRHASVTAGGRLHYLLYNVDGDKSLGYWELAGMVSYDL